MTTLEGWFATNAKPLFRLPAKAWGLAILLAIAVCSSLTAGPDELQVKLTQSTRAYVATFISDPSLYAVQTILHKKSQEKEVELPGFVDLVKVPVDYYQPRIVIIIDSRTPQSTKKMIKDGLPNFYAGLHLSPSPTVLIKEQNLVGSYYDRLSDPLTQTPPQVKVTLATQPTFNIKLDPSPQFKIQSVLTPAPQNLFQQIMNFKLLFVALLLSLILFLLIRKYSHQLGIKFDELGIAFKSQPPQVIKMGPPAAPHADPPIMPIIQGLTPFMTNATDPIEIENLEISYDEIRDYFLNNPATSISMIEKWLGLPDGKCYLKGLLSILGVKHIKAFIQNLDEPLQRRCESVLGDQTIYLTKVHLSRVVQETYQTILFAQSFEKKKGEGAFDFLNLLDNATLLKVFLETEIADRPTFIYHLSQARYCYLLDHVSEQDRFSILRQGLTGLNRSGAEILATAESIKLLSRASEKPQDMVNAFDRAVFDRTMQTLPSLSYQEEENLIATLQKKQDFSTINKLQECYPSAVFIDHANVSAIKAVFQKMPVVDLAICIHSKGLKRLAQILSVNEIQRINFELNQLRANENVNKPLSRQQINQALDRLKLVILGLFQDRPAAFYQYTMETDPLKKAVMEEDLIEPMRA